jgi:hypothetical protein
LTKEKKQNNMEPTDEFRDFGKKLPYQEPTGFFDKLPERTLQEAKRREQNHKKTVVLWRTVAVAASLSALALLGYFMLEPERPELHQIVQVKQPVEQPQITNQEIIKQPVVAEIKKAAVPENVIAKESDAEEIVDVLADLSDEELTQLAAMYKADPFISESEQ